MGRSLDRAIIQHRPRYC